MKILESGENYLETILILKAQQGSVRSIDIATELGFTKPSVSVAMKRLRERNLITVDKDGIIEFTKEGKELAENIYERHIFLTELLISIGVSPEVAADDACRVEHYISQETFDKIKEYCEKKS